MSIVREVTENRWPAMRELIDDVLSEAWMNPFTADMIRYQLETGGKRIRPAVVLGVHRAFGGDDEKAIPFAAAVEIIHNASLVHDDVQDGDEYRRGRFAAWKKYSKDQAINLGDILFTLAFEVFMRSRLREGTMLEIVRLTMRAVGELVNGQVREIVFREGFDVPIDDYFDMVRGKTGSLFKLASTGAFVLTENGSESHSQELDRLGCCLGNMFQVRDDIIDIIGLKEGRSPGSDVMEGKVSVLTSISLAKLDGKGRKELVDMLNAPREGKEDGIVKKVARIYRETGALRDAYGLYEREKAKIFAIPVMKHNARLGEFMEEIIDSISTPLKDLERNF